MGRYSSKTCRLVTMLALTSVFFLVEITVGYITNSIALVADSFHMLSDVVALIVAFASVRISKWPTKRNTFGWVRAEILGALVNAVFLLALCFSITVESLQRLVEVEEVGEPKLMLIVGAVGLAVNVVGLFLFGGDHGHSHGNHGHSHGSKGKPHEQMQEEKGTAGNGSSTKTTENDSLMQQEIVSSSATLSEDKEIYATPNITIEVKKPKIASSHQLNMRGVFLHVLGDALGSVVVVISALVIWFAEGQWRFYIDPAMSLIMVVIILSTTIPLLKESAFILLQTVPSHVNVEDIINDLEQMDGIYGVHECHIWQLAGNRIVASAHIRCHGIEEYMTLAAKIKKVFHKAGIHSTTIQPEFIDWQDRHAEYQSCVLLCDVGGEQCKKNTCCGDRRDNKSKRSTPSGSEKGASVNSSTPGNKNNSNIVSFATQNAPPSKLSLDMKFSPEGDEIVLEMTEVLKLVIEAKDESVSVESLHSPQAPALTESL